MPCSLVFERCQVLVKLMIFDDAGEVCVFELLPFQFEVKVLLCEPADVAVQLFLGKEGLIFVDMLFEHN